jgi:hypothetical protein
MTAHIACLEARGIAAAEKFFAFIRNENNFARENVDEFIRFDVPVSLAGPTSGRQAQLIDPELRQAGGIAKPLALPRATRLIEWWRIHCADDRSDSFGIDSFGHDYSREFQRCYGFSEAT